MAVSRKCDNCFEVKRCRMVVTREGIEYLCGRCVRELGYDAGTAVNWQDEREEVSER